VSLNIVGAYCVVVGDGEAADERVSRLAAAGAKVVRVSAKDFGRQYAEYARVIMITVSEGAEDLARIARGAQALVYVTDRPDLSDFALPALVRRGSLQIAVSTDGDAPALARRFREELARLIVAGGPELDALLDELTRVRAELPAGERKDPLYRIASRLSIDGHLRID
jgi:precorrin-2 dehydrogenase/sirohydrochlorin ferrochelatase